MDRRLDKLKESLQSAVKGMSSEQLRWHPPGKWCAFELLEHLYLTYTGTITGFERILRKGKPLASQASIAQHALTFVVVGLGHIPARVKAPNIVQPRGLPVEKVRNEIAAKIMAVPRQNSVRARNQQFAQFPHRKICYDYGACATSPG